MKESYIGIISAIVAGVLVAGTAGWIGYEIGKGHANAEPAEPEVATTVRKAPAPAAEPDPFPRMTDGDIEDLIAEAEASPPKPGVAAAAERRRRWENMPMEQRRLLRKSMFAALSKVEGLEEVGDAIREGKIDPRQFKIDPESLADRMEFYAETMDEQAMETEVTKTLQGIVDQARSQLK